MQLVRNRLFMAASLGHMVLDIFNSSGPVIVAFLSIELGLNNAMIAVAIGTYQFVGSLSQPVFGWIADQYGGRWLMGLSVVWTVGFLVLSIFAAQTGVFWLFLLLYVSAALGSGAFHPVGTKFAALTATKRAATFTALFFLFGQFGLAAGPAVSGFMLDTIGLIGFPLMAAFVAPILLFVVSTQVPGEGAMAQTIVRAQTTTDSVTERVQLPWPSLGILCFHTLCRSWAQIGTISFIPKLFQDKGWSPTMYGALLSTMWIASAITGVVAGNVADRWGRRQVIMVVMLLAAVPLYFFPITNDINTAFLLALLVGGLTGAPHSITVVIAQGMMPGKQATASGIILGLIFGLGAVATFAIGFLADIWTLERAIQLGALISVFAAVSALALPSTRHETRTEATATKVST